MKLALVILKHFVLVLLKKFAGFVCRDSLLLKNDLWLLLPLINGPNLTKLSKVVTFKILESFH